MLLTDENDLTKIKIADLGIAAQLTAEQRTLSGRCGTLIFMAHEIFNPNFGGIYSTPVDIFATGFILYMLLMGTHPLY